jgi:predicted lipoprotein with Yx(FWY)xxD motif
MLSLTARLPLAAVVTAAAAFAVTPCSVASSSAARRPPVVVIKTPNLGKVLATPGKLGLYTWNVEKKAGGKIRCTGACATAWPPVLVKGPVQRQVTGIKATFGTIKRPNGKLQLTVNGLPVYTYEHDTANVVLCDDVDGWFAIRQR